MENPSSYRRDYRNGRLTDTERLRQRLQALSCNSGISGITSRPLRTDIVKPRQVVDPSNREGERLGRYAQGIRQVMPGVESTDAQPDHIRPGGDANCAWQIGAMGLA